MLNATFVLPIVHCEIDGEHLFQSDESVENEQTVGPKLSGKLKKRFRDIVADVYRLGYI